MSIIIQWFQRSKKLSLNKKPIFLLIGMSLMATITEIFGVGIFLPIFQYMRMEGDLQSLVSNAPIWQYVINFFNFIHIQISLAVLLITSFLFFLIRQVFNYFRIIYESKISQKLNKKLRDVIFDSYLDSNSEFQDSMPVGSLVNVITTEVNHAVLGIMAPLKLFVLLVICICYVIAMAFLSLQMTLVSVVVLLVVSRIPRAWIRASTIVGRKIVDANMSMSFFLVQRLKSPRLARLSMTEPKEKKYFNTLTKSQCNHNIDSSILAAKTDVALEPFVILLSLFFLYFAHTVFHLQFEVIGIYLVVALRLMPVVKSIVSQWQAVQRWLGSIEIVEDRIKDMQLAKENDFGQINEINNSHIKFEAVSYIYPDSDKNALKDISIEFLPGSLTMLVGPSGSGKSTLVDLIPRLRESSEGVIYIGNNQIDRYKLSSLRSVISYVPQEPQIFDGSMIDHIKYGAVDFTKEDVTRVVKLSGLDQFVYQLPDGLNTFVGEDGFGLSGGQKQRLDLARALLRKVSILILDEPTSNLDYESIELFRKSINRIRKEMSVSIIIVTHNLDNAGDADNIIVLSKGKVSAQGNHDELLISNKWYKNAWDKA
jgi:ABC-type multidrug transport system fused ATPase/permease subunit